MIKLLEQYFIEHEVLDLPQLGTLRKIKKEANFSDYNWTMPKEFIVYDNYQNKPSSQFYSYIADNLDISEQTAILQLDQLVNDFLASSEEELTIGSLGSFKHNEGVIEWLTAYQSEQYFSPIDLPILAQTSNESESEVESNKWIIGAFSLLLIALFLIIYKYY